MEVKELEVHKKVIKMSKVSALYFKWKKSKSKDNIGVGPVAQGATKSQRSRSLDPESLHKTGLREFILKVCPKPQQIIEKIWGTTVNDRFCFCI